MFSLRKIRKRKERKKNLIVQYTTRLLNFKKIYIIEIQKLQYANKLKFLRKIREISMTLVLTKELSN